MSLFIWFLVVFLTVSLIPMVFYAAILVLVKIDEMITQRRHRR